MAATAPRSRGRRPGEAASNLGTALLEACNTRDLGAWARVLADDVAVSYPGFRGQRGAAAARAYQAAFLFAFSDLQYRITASVEQHLEQGGRFTTTWWVTGTHDGDLATADGIIPPTGRASRVEGVSLVTVHDGRIVKEEIYWDRMELFGQLRAQRAGGGSMVK